MTVVATTVSVGTTATRLTSTTEGDDHTGHSILFTPPSAIYVGGSDVDTSTHGFLLTAGVEYGLDVSGPNDALFGIVAAGSVSVPVLRTGV